MKPLISMCAATAFLALIPATAQAASAPLPHIIFEYTFRDNGARWDLSVERHYETCTYVGPHGAFTVPAEFGNCPTIRWFHEDGSAQ